MSEVFDPVAAPARAKALHDKFFPPKPVTIFRPPEPVRRAPPRIVVDLPEVELPPVVLVEKTMARDILDLQTVPSPLRGKLLAKQIVAEIADRHGVTSESIFGHERHKPIVVARHEAYWAVRKQFPYWSFPELGRFFRRDHSTLVHAIRKMAAKEAALG